MPKVDDNFKDMFYPLNELLEDICNFLYDERMMMMTEKDRKMAESIVTRSREQMKALSRLKPLIQSNEEYVTMNKDEDNNETEHPKSPASIPFSGLSAKDVSKEEKYGYIHMKRKFLLGFERMYRIYAAIHNKFLLVYHSERASKPLHVLDLTYYEATPICERTGYFNLIGFDSNCKTYHFQAPTYEEMVSWVTRMNRCSMQKKRRNTETTENDTNKEDICNMAKSEIHTMNNHCHRNIDNIYEDIFYKAHYPGKGNSDEIHNGSEDAPPLPVRTTVRSPQNPAVSIVSLPLPKCPPERQEEAHPANTEEQPYHLGYNSINIRLADDDDDEDVYEEVHDLGTSMGQPTPSKESESSLKFIVTSVSRTKIRAAEKPPISKKPTNLSSPRRINLS